MSYNIFISCKSQDYPKAEKIAEFLRNNGLNPFIASESLRIIGNAAYLDEIYNALNESQHLILYCSKPEYADSKFVKEEWQSFINELLSGRKTGNILTITADKIDVGQLPYGLRKYEVITYSQYEKILLNYLVIKDGKKVIQAKVGESDLQEKDTDSPTVQEVERTEEKLEGQSENKESVEEPQVSVSQDIKAPEEVQQRDFLNKKQVKKDFDIYDYIKKVDDYLEVNGIWDIIRSLISIALFTAFIIGCMALHDCYKEYKSKRNSRFHLLNSRFNTPVNITPINKDSNRNKNLDSLRIRMIKNQ